MNADDIQPSSPRIPDGEIVRVQVGMTLQEVEKAFIAATLRHTNGNMKEAASLLDINRSTMYAKVKLYGIQR